MRVIFETKADMEAWQVCCYFSGREEYEEFLKWDGKRPFPKYGSCIVHLLIPKGTACVSEDYGPSRCSRAFVTKVLGLDKKPLESGIVTSMYDTEVICRQGEEIKPARPLETEGITERFTGIHYFKNLEDALKWAGKD